MKQAGAAGIPWMQRWLGAESPGLAATAVVFSLLTAGLVWMTLSQPSFLAPAFDPDLGWWLAALLLLLWPFCSLVTHTIALKSGLYSSFRRVLLVTGRAWLLHAAALVFVNACLALFEWAGWKGWAELWYLTLRGGVIWLVYPAALRESYGRQARSRLLTLITGSVVFLLVVVVFWLAYLFPNLNHS
jgi:hypothetical protein